MIYFFAFVGLVYSCVFGIRLAMTLAGTYKGWCEIEADDSSLRADTTIGRAKTFGLLFISLWFTLPMFWITKCDTLGD